MTTLAANGIFYILFISGALSFTVSQGKNLVTLIQSSLPHQIRMGFNKSQFLIPFVRPSIQYIGMKKIVNVLKCEKRV